MGSLILLALVTSYVVLSNWWLKKRFNIEEKEDFSSHVNKTHKLIERILTTIAIMGGIFIIYRDLNPLYWLVPNIILITIVRTIMEWKYERERKVYILSLNALIVYLFMAVTITVFII